MGDILTALPLELRHQDVVDDVAVVGRVGGDDAQHPGLAIEVLGRVLVSRELHLARGHVDARHLVAPPLGEPLHDPGRGLRAGVEVGGVGLGELVTETDASNRNHVVARQLGEALGADRGVPEDRVRVVGLHHPVELGEDALVVAVVALPGVGVDVHLAAVEDEVLVEEVLEGGVESLGVVVGVEQALRLEDGIDLGAVVGDVVDQLDGVAGHPGGGGAAVVAEGRAGGAGYAGRRPVAEGGIELPPLDAVGGVAGERRRGRTGRARAAGGRGGAGTRRPRYGSPRGGTRYGGPRSGGTGAPLSVDWKSSTSSTRRSSSGARGRSPRSRRHSFARRSAAAIRP